MVFSLILFEGEKRSRSRPLQAMSDAQQELLAGETNMHISCGYCLHSFICVPFVCARSLLQAWEVLGLAMEKEMDYEHSCECYEKVHKCHVKPAAMTYTASH